VLTPPSQPHTFQVLDAFANILKHGEASGGGNAYADFVDECGGMEKIEQLQNHENEELYKKALSIMERYFADEDDDEIDMGAPTASSTTAFTFGSGLPVAASSGFAF
jgi:importin subunit alpha-1